MNVRTCSKFPRCVLDGKKNARSVLPAKLLPVGVPGSERKCSTNSAKSLMAIAAGGRIPVSAISASRSGASALGRCSRGTARGEGWLGDRLQLGQGVCRAKPKLQPNELKIVDLSAAHLRTILPSKQSASPWRRLSSCLFPRLRSGIDFNQCLPQT